jgi:coenzyme F420-reducing hydrogenase beta subunit
MVYDYDDDLFKPLPLLEGRLGVEAMDAASESDKDVHLMLECGDNEDPSGMQRYDEDLLHIEPIDVYSQVRLRRT